MGSVRRAPLALVVALALVAPALAGDIVINQQGKPLGNPKAAVPPGSGDYAGSSWEVTDETLDGVTYRIEGVAQSQTLPASSVKMVYHDPETVPPALTAGRQLMERGDFAAARDQLGRVAKDAEALPWAKQEAAYLAAESYLDEGNAPEAEKQLAGFKSAFPKSKWVTSATAARARALLALDKIEDAKSEFASLKKLPGVPEEIGVEADYSVVRIDYAVAVNKGDQAGLANAQKGFEALLQKTSGKSQFERTSRLAQIGRAACMTYLGKPADAKAELEKAIKDVKDARVLAAAYNALGTATWRAAAADKAQMRAALFHYMRVVVLYSEEPGTDEDAAEAGYHAGELFRELKDTAPDYPARARREWAEVASKYPGTTWALRSREAMAGR